jgi:hypothetical protein
MALLKVIMPLIRLFTFPFLAVIKPIAEKYQQKKPGGETRSKKFQKAKKLYPAFKTLLLLSPLLLKISERPKRRRKMILHGLSKKESQIK